MIEYGLTDCSLGRLLVAGTTSGVCALYLGDVDDALVGELRREFAGALVQAVQRPTLKQDSLVHTWLNILKNHPLATLPQLDVPLAVSATDFQRRVWSELRNIPAGQTRTYQEVAVLLGCPTAARAVGRACATNPVSLVVPCHRVVRGDGGLGGYRWGLERKRTLLELEKAQV